MASRLLVTRTKIWPLAFVIILAIAVLPGKSALEGDQRSIEDISDKSDNWGFLTAYLYGEWPSLLGDWRISLIIFQLVISLCGFLLLTDNFRPKNLKSGFVYYSLFFVSSMFSVQLWRDATLYSFSLFGFGLINFSFGRSIKLKLLLNSAGWTILVFACMFKPVLSIAVIPLLVWLIWQNHNGNFSKTLLLVMIPLTLLSTFPGILDKNLSKIAKMQSVYPEQQPIILDLAMNYCWGQSESIRKASEQALMGVVRPNYPVESVCAATNPFRWDDLHQDPKDWEFSSPVIRIIDQPQEAKVRKLISDWIYVVIRNPADWLQVRLLFIGPVLFMSNSFVSHVDAELDSKPLDLISNALWIPIHFTISLLDKMRITSLFLLFLFQFLLLFRFSKNEQAETLIVRKEIYFSICSSIVTLTLANLTFLAPNGRYVLPYILLNYILLFRLLSKVGNSPLTA